MGQRDRKIREENRGEKKNIMMPYFTKNREASAKKKRKYRERYENLENKKGKKERTDLLIYYERIKRRRNLQ